MGADTTVADTTGVDITGDGTDVVFTVGITPIMVAMEAITALVRIASGTVTSSFATIRPVTSMTRIEIRLFGR